MATPKKLPSDGRDAGDAPVPEDTQALTKPCAASDATSWAAQGEGLTHLIRVKATGIAAGPDDPGGWFWVVPVASGLWLLRLLRGSGRSRRDDWASD